MILHKQQKYKVYLTPEGFVVACMETVLEHRSLDVVSHPLVFGGEGLYLSSQFGSGDILLGEVSPGPSLFFLPGNAPLLLAFLAVPCLGLATYGRDGFSGLLVNNGQLLPFQIEVEPRASLHLSGHEFHFLVPVMGVCLGELPVGRTLVGAVGMEPFNSVSGHTLTLCDSFFKKLTVGMSRRLNLHAGDKTGLALLSTSLRDIGGISLNWFFIFVPAGGIGIVGVLKAVGRYLILWTDAHYAILDNILLFKHLFEKGISVFFDFEYGIYGFSKYKKICLHCLGIGAVNRLGGILFQIFLNAAAKDGLENRHIRVLEIFAHGLVYKDISGVERNVAADEFAVHPHALARHSVCLGLIAGHLFKALLQQVLAFLGSMPDKGCAEVIVCGCAWNVLFKSVKPQCLACEKVVFTFLKQLLVAARTS